MTDNKELHQKLDEILAEGGLPEAVITQAIRTIYWGVNNKPSDDRAAWSKLVDATADFMRAELMKSANGIQPWNLPEPVSIYQTA